MNRAAGDGEFPAFFWTADEQWCFLSPGGTLSFLPPLGHSLDPARLITSRHPKVYKVTVDLIDAFEWSTSVLPRKNLAQKSTSKLRSWEKVCS